MERISSLLTFFYKYIVTTLWPLGFGAIAVLMFLSTTPSLHKSWTTLALGGFLGTAIFLWLFANLKRVYLEGDTLIISNYLNEIRVKCHDIKYVAQNTISTSQNRPITIEFKNKTRFGKSVTFIPKLSVTLIDEDDIVAKLRHLAYNEAD